MPRPARKPRLSAIHRRTKGFKPPMGVAKSYAFALRTWLQEVQALILERMLDGWETNRVAFGGQLPSGQSRFDAPPSEYLGIRIAGIKVQLEQRLDPAKLGPQIKVMAKRVATANGDEFRRVIGISSKDTGLKPALDQFQDRNVGLIKTLVGKQLDDVRSIVEEAESGAWRVEVLSDKLKDSFGVSESRANLIARDQVLKLNGQLTQTRQKGAGITKYIWTTAGDERVRGNPDGPNPRGLHYDLDGTTQSWDAPPEISEDGRTGHPGDDYQCRCTAFPVLDELDGDDSEE